MTPRVVMVLGLIAASIVVACAAAARILGGDPMLGAELGLAALLAAWASALVARARPALAGQRELERSARPLRLHDHDVRLISALRTEAFVAGPFRPAIYVTRSLLDVLDASELQAVVLHEEHHRRQRDPLRSLALVSWGRFLGWLPGAERWIDRRLAHLEIAADQYALDNGASRAAMASALLKCDPSAPVAAMGFTAAADIRLRRLVSDSTAAEASAPMEWLGPLTLTCALVACHLFLG
jgi:beta-lactamase regulating signal transducer with metallopeptidase domain